MKDKISVIVPVYNVADYLRNCVESICNQTYKNIELILVDDGSTDESGQICEELAGWDTRIKAFHQKNQGAAAARNTGLNHACGDYISIIDGDDFILPQMFEVMLEAIHRFNCDFACCPYQLVDTHRIEECGIENEKHMQTSLFSKREIYQHLFDYHTMWVIQPNKLYKSELFEEYRFPAGHFYEDEYAAHHLLKEVKQAVYIDAPFYCYFNRQGSATRRGITSRQLFLLDALIDRIDFFLQEEEYQMLPIAEDCLFEAYRSVAVGMRDRNTDNRRFLRKIKKNYRLRLARIKEYLDLNRSLKIKRCLYLRLPRVMEYLIQLKNAKKGKTE